MRTVLHLAFSGLCLLSWGSLRADEIVLTNGNRLEGLVIKSTDEVVVVQITGGSITLKRREVREIKSSPWKPRMSEMARVAARPPIMEPRKPARRRQAAAAGGAYSAVGLSWYTPRSVPTYRPPSRAATHQRRAGSFIRSGGRSSASRPARASSRPSGSRSAPPRPARAPSRARVR